MNRKIVVLNGSPHGIKGTTGALLKAFVEGLEDGGCGVTTFEVAKMYIGPCMGELSCWFKTDGDCIQNDEMTQINDAISNCDTLVLATPVYVDGMTGSLKNAVDRMVCQVLPFVEIVDNHLRHPKREKSNQPKSLILVSTCGFWEMDNFDPLITHVKAICKNLWLEYKGAILRPHAAIVYYSKQVWDAADDILKTVKNTGKEYAETGLMSEENLLAISKPLVDQNGYAELMNENFKRAISKQEEKNK